MSCPECRDEQATLEKAYFYRIGNGNVLVFGCVNHVSQMFDRLNSQEVSK